MAPSTFLPFGPPIEPMLAKLSGDVPEGKEAGDFLYEPKWDGFRSIVFRDGDELYIQSRELKQLNRYFPELEAPLRENLPERCILDGEVVIATDGRLDFDALLTRIHPAKSRAELLGKQHPASFVAFDCLSLDGEDLRAQPNSDRRKALERALSKAKPPVHLTPFTTDSAVARDWFKRFEGAGLDGVMAKPKGLGYQPGKRAIIKVKHARTADCAVAGFRWYKDAKNELVGSLLLGLYDNEGKLNHVGICASFTRERRAELVKELEPLREGAREAHPWKEWADWQSEAQRMPGATSRWNRGKDLSWEPLRIERVAEVGYDNLQGTRFRHATHFKRWRPDRTTDSCRYDQLEVTPALELKEIFGG